MSTLTASQFAADCLGLAPLAPPKGYAAGADCWLCGGPTHGIGWPLRAAIAPTFTNHNLARAPASDAVCWQCVAMSSKATWEAYAAAHPAMGLKTGHAMSWRFYSHIFSAEGHECPDRARWRELLILPPEPPFLAVMSTSGQKHLIFRAKVARDHRGFWLQFEDESVWLDTGRFVDVLLCFEALYALGFSKDQILSGQYHHGQLLKVDRTAWHELERRMALYRQQAPQYVRIAHFIAQRPDAAAPETAPLALRGAA